MDPFQTTAAIGSGVIVGFSLGLIGGGGSILAVPLLLYIVGMPDPHQAIGTSALAVAVNAYANLVPHARAQHVRWGPAVTFASAGVVGAFAGSSIGKVVDGHQLLILFALLMLFVAALMLRGRKADTSTSGVVQQKNLLRLVAIGLGTGTLSGFYGIGGGFLVVPGLILATGMPTIAAIGSSLVAVGTFGMTTAVNYAVSGLVDWPVALLFILGGIAGGWIGARIAKRLSAQRQTLTRLLGCMLVVVSAYMLYRSFT
ncbi:MAG TPA: sulfite exporter TauE/SafE family protein [Acetobacteraceae bacterium]|nr:sulfite exporter TauE/SafE family protein [Acetobacteraceae bacterium]